jgi:hypothetical protein
VLACLAVAAFVASCGDDDDSSSATAATSPASGGTGAGTAAGSVAPGGDVCADRAALSDSIAALRNVDLRAEGTNGLTAAISAVKDDLTALRASAGDELQPQVQAVQTALDEVQTAVGNIASGGVAPAVTAVTNLGSASATLLDQLQAGACGTGSTTATT